MRKRKTKEFSKDFLTPMSIEEIRAKVNAAVPGAIYNVMIIDGSPLTLKEGRVLYVTETFVLSPIMSSFTNTNSSSAFSITGDSFNFPVLISGP